MEETKILKIAVQAAHQRKNDIVLSRFNNRLGVPMLIIAREYTHEEAMSKPGARHAWNNPERWYAPDQDKALVAEAPKTATSTEQLMGRVECLTDGLRPAECLERYTQNMREGARHELTPKQKLVAQQQWAMHLSSKVEDSRASDKAKSITVCVEVDDAE